MPYPSLSRATHSRETPAAAASSTAFFSLICGSSPPSLSHGNSSAALVIGFGGQLPNYRPRLEYSQQTYTGCYTSGSVVFVIQALDFGSKPPA
ncbi:hypothetical protein ABVT39_021500 [Epinephelus coioides]